MDTDTAAAGIVLGKGTAADTSADRGTEVEGRAVGKGRVEEVEDK